MIVNETNGQRFDIRQLVSWGILLLLFAIAFSRFESGMPLGDPAPMIQTQLLDGQSFDSTQMRGKVIILDFWATWCGPCQASLPALSRVVQKYEKEDWVWIGSVNTDEDLSDKQVAGFLKGRQLKIPVILDPNSAISYQFHVRSLQTMVVIDSEGRVKHTESGIISRNPDVLYNELVNLIESFRP